jgi:hypothetical protein
LQRNIEELKAEIQTIKSLHRESENSYWINK